MNATTIHLLHTQPNPRHLAAWAARHRLLQSRGDWGSDLGYALHGLLRAVFGEVAPQPYRYLDARQGLLAYTHLDADAVARAVALADAEAAAALGLSTGMSGNGYSLRPFPTQWPVDHVLNFEVRVRPVIREGSSGRERDAFLVASEQAGPRGERDDLDRGDVYGQWLRRQLMASESGAAEPWHGAVDVLDVSLQGFQLLDVMRFTQVVEPDGRRKRHSVAGPDARLSGRLRVRDTQAFAHLIKRGVGRHRAFGYGMLLLRPAG